MRPNYDLLIKRGLPALILIFQIIMLLGCETLPDFRQKAISFNYKGEPLKIVDGKGPLPPDKLYGYDDAPNELRSVMAKRHINPESFIAPLPGKRVVALSGMANHPDEGNR